MSKRKLHISLTDKIMQISDKVLTPPGFFEPIKGAYSQLIEGLLQQHFEKLFSANIFDITEYFEENANCTIEDAVTYFKNKLEKGNEDGNSENCVKSKTI